ncbi:hypothetical protein SmJEL517_g04846 [Synchytrium microbalum]|uniref:MPN domain-containing protein n=1 Tax=Synchytrium microbalum TaxID=1806994 RepID=A0A507BWW0_9FUNG|nr:uncharacterized protein SmJEL517_g04846 [Synchytrium microbalum]TPX31932.1 hypothetical protein SmJEL517_g04846 [Synchytrium microbalum]
MDTDNNNEGPRASAPQPQQISGALPLRGQTSAYRGRGRGSYHRGGSRGGGMNSSYSERSTTPEHAQHQNVTSNEISSLFSEFREVLDDTYDRRERIIKISRDVTIYSKRLIFLLHRCNIRTRDSVLEEAKAKQQEIIQLLRRVSVDLTGSDFYRHKFAVQPGLEEYIEAVSFLVYLESGELVKREDINAQLVDEHGTPFLQITEEDYLLGITDLTGELMRLAINGLVSGSPSTALQVCQFLRQLKADFEILDFPPARRKMNEMRNSLKKVEDACYSVKVRGSEYGTQRRLQRLFGQTGGAAQMQPGLDQPTVDTAEMVHISSLALLKMLKHGRAGVPMEVMGLMLGEFVDDYTVRVIDVFAMPQSGTGVSVEAVDPVFQTKMLDMLKQTGRPEQVVGWYHSHPGFGCWLSSVDVQTQQSFEQLHQRAVAVVVDPIQSVKGKVVIDAFRLINPQSLMMQQEPRQTTSNIGHLNKPSIQALIHGLNRHYYSIAINYRKNELEQKMLLNLHKKTWTSGLILTDFNEHSEQNEKAVKSMLTLAESYNKSVIEEITLTPEQLKTRHVGKQDPKRHLEEMGQELMTTNIVQCLASMLDSVSF